MPELILTPSQQRFVTQAPNWYNGHNPFGVLEAAAGFGKTFVVRYFLERMGNRVKPLLLAETNEAVRVLKRATNAQYDCMTVCKALNLVLDSRSETKELVQHAPPDLSNYTLIILDEASQVDGKKLKLLMELGIYILFIGHRSQLPPIEKNQSPYDKCLSPVFLEEGFTKFALTEPVRNKTEIWEYCTLLEQSIYEYVNVPSRFRVTHKFLTEYLTQGSEGRDLFHEGQTVALAYTNKTVLSMNAQIRLGMFGDEASVEKFLIGDRVLFREPALGYPYGILPNVRTIEQCFNKSNVQYAVNTKGVVLKVDSQTVLGIDCYKLTVKTDHYEEENQTAIFYSPIDEDKFAVFRKKLYNSALFEKNPAMRSKKWKVYHDCTQVFTNVRHGYSMTVHNSQGSSIPNVIVDVADVGKCSNAVMIKKLNYVACSRASEKLWRMV